MTKAQSILSDLDLKITGNRMLVLDYFNKKHKPMAVDEVYADLCDQGKHMDRATLYRIVDAFLQKGIIQRVEFGEGKYRYEMQRKKHHHLICEKCGKIEDTFLCNIDELKEKIYKDNNFKVTRHSLEFYGLCERCLY